MKVLVAIDDSDVSRKAVGLVGKVFGHRQDVDVTLFHVVESLPEYILARSDQGGVDSAFRQVADEWAETCRTQGNKLLADTTLTLTAAGIPPAKVGTKLEQKECRPEARRVISAIAIIDEMKEGNYDVIVVGRRSNSAAVQSFIGGVAEKVVREAHGRTVWIVD